MGSEEVKIESKGVLGKFCYEGETYGHGIEGRGFGSFVLRSEIPGHH